MQNAPLGAFCNTYDPHCAIIGLENICGLFESGVYTCFTVLLFHFQEDMVIKAGRYYLIAIAIMIPYGLTLITSTLKWIFGGFMFPHTSTFIVVSHIEYVRLEFYHSHINK